MFNIETLNGKLVVELREIANAVGIENSEDLRKQDLIAKILEKQATGEHPINNESNLQPTEAVVQEALPSVGEVIFETPVFSEKTLETANNNTFEPTLFSTTTGTKEPTNVATHAPSISVNTKNNKERKDRQSEINLDFDNVIVSEGVLEIVQDGY